MSTYTEYDREYYQKNKDRIRVKTRAYRKAYNKEYWALKGPEILKKRWDARRARGAVIVPKRDGSDPTKKILL